ncbi:MAG: molybdopterin-dependent oxidoreductase, partial [Gemmatimonadales bacterium]
LHACDWEVAVARLASLVGEADRSIVVLVGGRASCESIGWALRLAGEAPRAAAMRVPFGDEAPIGAIPGLALRRERAANLEGARMLGMTSNWGDALAALDGAALAIVLDADLDDAGIIALNQVPHVVQLATVPDPRLQTAELVLPIATMAEEQGVYVNRDRRAQRYLPARPAPGMARPAWWVAAHAWSRGAPGRHAPATASEAFGLLAPFAGLTYRDLGLTGRIVGSTPAGVTT